MYIKKKLTTERLVLKAYTAVDAIPFHNLLQVNKEHFSDSFPNLLARCKDLKACKQFIADQKKMWEVKTKIAYGMHLQSEDKLIGHIFLKNIDWMIPKSEVGYLIDAKYQGLGLTTEAVQCITTYGFQKLKMNKIYLRAFPDNIASQKVALKTGFQLEGQIRNDFKRQGKQLTDVLYYGRIS